ncbi:laminin subunit alpha-2-like [Lytechinus variegatus]|uniref:laminin subunit alpha-2-like n=1 Tax=Lytechinus variegatus TaxID=7654 RepID=UPI001BB16629|nr:laminin subunit alpha-2-like [Lytechinus variegatus]
MSDPTENYYAALQLMEGFVFFNFKIGSSPVFMDSDFVIDDGYWHTIEISRNRKTGSLQVDGTKRKRAKSNNGRKNLNIQSPIYIGGLPLNRQSPNIYGDGFDGCIRKFRLNGIDIDLRGTANNSYGVVTCYTNTEPGHYFQGIGHALLANQQQIGSDFQLLIEFRTAQKDGLLFAATDLDGVGVTVIISDHDIHLKLYTGRRMAMIPFQAHDNFTVCDYQWHVVQVTEIDGLWQLSVDGIMANNLRGTVRLPGDERYQFYAGGNPLSNPDAVKFKGCIRRLEVNGGVVPVESSVEIVGVVPLECPIV